VEFGLQTSSLSHGSSHSTLPGEVRHEFVADVADVVAIAVLVGFEWIADVWRSSQGKPIRPQPLAVTMNTASAGATMRPCMSGFPWLGSGAGALVTTASDLGER
jgi:hypothetical protein